MAFSPDGALLATGSNDDLVRLWDVRTGDLVRTLEGHGDSVYGVAFSPGGLCVASGGRGKAHFWQACDGTSLSGYDDVLSSNRILFSPDGKRVVADSGYDLHFWNFADGNPLVELDGHRGEVNGILFAADGTWLVTGSSDHTVRLWGSAVARCQPLTVPLLLTASRRRPGRARSSPGRPGRPAARG